MPFKYSRQVFYYDGRTDEDYYNNLHAVKRKIYTPQHSITTKGYKPPFF